MENESVQITDANILRARNRTPEKQPVTSFEIEKEPETLMGEVIGFKEDRPIIKTMTGRVVVLA